MKKAVLFLVLLIVVGVLLLAGLSEHGFSLGGLSYAWNPEAAELRRLAESFLEDLQFKDFERASLYHTLADQEKVDIPTLIERMFKVKPEQLNIRDIQVTKVDLDSRGRRARTFFTATTELLNSARNPDEEQNEERRVEGVLYWHRRPGTEGPQQANEISRMRETYAGENWFMMLESSLPR